MSYWVKWVLSSTLLEMREVRCLFIYIEKIAMAYAIIKFPCMHSNFSQCELLGLL